MNLMKHQTSLPTLIDETAWCHLYQASHSKSSLLSLVLQASSCQFEISHLPLCEIQVALTINDQCEDLTLMTKRIMSSCNTVHFYKINGSL